MLFLIYINDIVTNIKSTVRLFADDTSQYLIVDEPVEAARCSNSHSELIFQRAEHRLVKFNAAKSESLLISRKANKPYNPKLLMNNEPIKEVTSHKHLGIFLSSDGTWHELINYITAKAWMRINVMCQLKFLLDRRSLVEIIYTSFIRPCFEYADVVWNNYMGYEVNALKGGARWLSGRVSDSGARGPGFETYRRRVVSLSKTLYSPKVLVNYPGSDGSVPTWLKNCWLGR